MIARSEFNRRLGKRIAHVRRARGLPQKTVASELGILRESYCYMETGRNKIEVYHAIRIAHILNVHVTDLLPRSEKEIV